MQRSHLNSSFHIIVSYNLHNTLYYYLSDVRLVKILNNILIFVVYFVIRAYVTHGSLYTPVGVVRMIFIKGQVVLLEMIIVGVYNIIIIIYVFTGLIGLNVVVATMSVANAKIGFISDINANALQHGEYRLLLYFRPRTYLYNIIYCIHGDDTFSLSFHRLYCYNII